MKITLDISKLLQEGQITQAEFEKLNNLAKNETGSLAFNVLVGFGVVAISAGSIMLAPVPATAIIIGAIAALFGIGILALESKQWALLANIAIAIGAFMFAGGLIMALQGSSTAYAIIVLSFLVGAVLARSGLLITASIFALSGCIGASTGYWHASYELSITQPTITIGAFSLIALFAYMISRYVSNAYEHLAIIAARTAVFMVNLGFWIGSLWGDTPGYHASSSYYNSTPMIPDTIFVIGWAVALFVVGVWGMARNRRWIVNVVTVFGAIHFYTQWFERLGANPTSVLFGGVIMLGIAFILRRYNHSKQIPTPIA